LIPGLGGAHGLAAASGIGLASARPRRAEPARTPRLFEEGTAESSSQAIRGGVRVGSRGSARFLGPASVAGAGPTRMSAL